MDKLNLVFLLIALLVNCWLINCDEDSTKLTVQNSNSTTKIELKADKQAYNPGQKIVIDIKIIDGQGTYELILACKDEEKCEKVFNCSTKCATVNVKNGIAEPSSINLEAQTSGHIILLLKNSTDEAIYPDLTKSFVRISIGQTQILDYLSTLCGWIYFVSWSVSFYPQIWLNIKRKSVVGLNFDFIALNVTGFFFYSIFNIAMYFVESVQNEYFAQNPFSLIPVEPNDVLFAVHAFFVSVITLIQCFCIYERQNQTISKPSVGLLLVFWSIAIISTFIVFLHGLNVLIYLNLLSYIKLFISFIKYIPQAYYNYQRKSTVGWSIGNILFDLTGGFFSLLQICLINFNYDDWGNIKGNLTKFGLGLLSMSFDFLFITQHYVLYRNREDHKRVQSSESSESDTTRA